MAALEHEDNVETRSAFYEALVRCRERARLHHDGALWGARFSADGETVLTWSDDGTARLWNLDGLPRGRLEHGSHVRAASFSNDGQIIATGTFDARVGLWSRDGSHRLWLDHGPKQGGSTTNSGPVWVQDLAFGSQDRWLASVCSLGTVRVWDVETGARLAGLDSERLPRISCWSRDRRFLSLAETVFIGTRPAGDTYRVLVYEFDGAQFVLRHETTSALPVRSMSFSPDGSSLAVVADAGAATRAWEQWVWNLPAREKVPLHHDGAVRWIHFSADGRHILTSGAEGVARLFSRDGRTVHSFDTTVVSGSAFVAPDRIVTYGDDYTVRVHDLRLSVLTELRGHFGKLRAPAMSPRGDLLVTASWDGTARLWDVLDREAPRLTGAHRGIVGIAQVSDGRLVSAGRRGNLASWDRDTGELVTRYDIHPGARSLSLSQDGRAVVVTHVDAIARRYDVETGAEQQRYPIGGDFTAARFLDGRRVLTSVRRGGLGRLVVRGHDGAEHLLGEREGVTNALAWAPRSALVAASGWQPKITVWRDDGTEVASWIAHSGRVNALAFSADERYLASCSDDATVRIWDLRRPQHPIEVPGSPLGQHDGGVSSVAWSADGRWLASGCTDASAHLWRQADGLGAIRDSAWPHDERGHRPVQSRRRPPLHRQRRRCDPNLVHRHRRTETPCGTAPPPIEGRRGQEPRRPLTPGQPALGPTHATAASRARRRSQQEATGYRGLSERSQGVTFAAGNRVAGCSQPVDVRATCERLFALACASAIVGSACGPR